MKNIRDKKLLYHLVRLSDLEKIFTEGLAPNRTIEGSTYLDFDFHAYAPQALKTQKEHSEETYVHICIPRAYAAKQGYQIYIKDASEKTGSFYEYEEGFAKIDWKQMEQMKIENTEGTEACCVSKNVLKYEQMQYIYVPDEKTAEDVEKMCQSMNANVKNKPLIHANRRMFV